MHNNKNNKLSLILILSLSLSIISSSVILTSNPITKAIKSPIYNNILNLKTSATINVAVSIDDLPSSPTNWTWAKDQGYCTGAGTSGNPYIIQNHFVNVSAGNSIEIKNSRKYFRIINCDATSTGFLPTGIRLENTTNGILRENDIFDVYTGIAISNCSFISVLNNIITGCNLVGIEIDNSFSITVQDNTIKMGGIGFVASTCTSSTFSSNEISDNLGDGMIIMLSSQSNTIRSNTIINNSNGIHLSTNSQFNTISSNTITNNLGDGILIGGGCHNNTISDNAVYQNYESGIELNNCDDCVIESNYAHHNGISGISLTTGCQHNIIKSNTANYNNWSGIYFFNDDDNLITKNIANSNEEYGIFLDACNDHAVIENVADGNGFSGIFLDGSNDNFIAYNTANNNNNGIYLDTSDNNIIAYNTLLNNLVCYNETGSTGNIYEGNICVAPPSEMDPFILGLIIGLVIGFGAFGIAIAATILIRKKKRKE